MCRRRRHYKILFNIGKLTKSNSRISAWSSRAVESDEIEATEDGRRGKTKALRRLSSKIIMLTIGLKISNKIIKVI